MQHMTHIQADGLAPEQQPMLNAAYPQVPVWNPQQQAFQSQPAPTPMSHDQYQAAILYCQMASAEKAREDAEAEKASREKYHREWMERYAAEKAAEEKMAAEKAAAEEEWREQRLAEQKQEKIRATKRRLEREAAFKIAEPIRKDEVQEYLGRQMALDPTWGVLPTYIYHVTLELVKQEMLNFEDEQDKLQADEFRRYALAVRYWHRWHRNARSMRLRRQGQLYRARVKEINKRKSQTPVAKEVDSQKDNKAFEISAKKAETSQIISSLGPKHTDSNPNSPPQYLPTSQLPEDTPSRHREPREPVPQNHDAPAQPSTKVAAHPSNANQRISQTTRVTDRAHSTAASTLSASDSTGIPVIDLIRGQSGPGEKISTFKNPYFLFKSHGIHPRSLQSLQREAAKRKREIEDEPTQTSQTSCEADSPPENKKRASSTHMQHLRSMSDESHHGIQQVLQEFEESESWFRQTRDQLQLSQSVKGTMSGSTASTSSGTNDQLRLRRPRSSPKYRSRQSKFVSKEQYGRWTPDTTRRSRDVTTISRQEDEDQMLQEVAAAAALVAANRADNAKGNGYSHGNRFAILAQDEDEEIDDGDNNEESEEIYEEEGWEMMAAEEEIEDEAYQDIEDDDEEIEIVATKANHGTGTGASADDAIELDSD
jgi:hypothetical protein